MGTSQSMGELAGKLGALASALSISEWALATHRDIAQMGKATANELGGTMEVWRKKAASHRGVHLTAWDQTTAQSTKIKPRQPGLWAIQEDGAKGHTEPKRFTRTGRQRKAGKVLTIPGGDGSGYAVSAHHPGRSGNHRWTRVRDVVEVKAPPIVDRHVIQAMARVFGAGS